LAGGPPVRGDLLIYWEPAGPIGEDERAHWLAAANRIGSGLATLAHLSVTVDGELFVVAFSCGKDVKLAANYEKAILRENLEARLIEAADGSIGVALPCRPDATDEEIKHAVLAGVKAAHAVEFIPITDPDVLDQLVALQAFEACMVDLSRKIKGVGAGIKRGLSRVVRVP
jgi:hypothetical protein